jgi:hypothetical protein|tara:strand:- start:3643 stop:3906 length:264 start_codon:yes stop_codon:yes gene_type:complete
MYKFLNILLAFVISIFFWSSYQYYSSNKNLKAKEFNRNNIDKIINKKISNLPVLGNDTNNVIEFNNTITSEIKNKKSRSFWNLLKFK